MSDGKCTGWFDGFWLDCCQQHDCDCAANLPLPCGPVHNLDLMRCVQASSYSKKVKTPELVRVNAIMMFVGVSVFNPFLVALNGLQSGVFGGEEESLL